MGHYTVKKVLKSDDKKVGQRFISWENYLTLHHLTMHSRLFTHIWPGPLLQQHCIITPNQLASLKGGFHKFEWCPSAKVREYLKHGKVIQVTRLISSENLKFRHKQKVIHNILNTEQT
jgi:hypothetical protein